MPLVGAAVSLEVVPRGGLEVFFISVSCVYEVVHPFCLFSTFYLFKSMIFFSLYFMILCTCQEKSSSNRSVLVSELG